MMKEANVIFKCQIRSEDKREDRFIKLREICQALPALAIITELEQASSGVGAGGGADSGVDASNAYWLRL